MRILLQGYYGFGNLGDDILLKTTFNFVKSCFQNSEVIIFSNANTLSNKYIIELVGENVKIIDYTYKGHFDLIIHGGGGVHYDFEKSSWYYFLLNTLIKLGGYQNFLYAHNLYKRIKRKEHITSSNRIGIGIGVGTFTKTSKKFHTNIAILASYDYLLVRDKKSVHNARKYLPKDRIFLSTDFAFKKNFWAPQISHKPIKKGKKVGFVLRNWNLDKTHLITLNQVIKNLTNKKILVTFFIFQKNQDLPIISKLNENIELKYWDPNHDSLTNFIGELNKQDLIITSRFHGTIIAASLGIPSLALAIEPKLEALHEILPSVKIIDLPISIIKLNQYIFEILSNKERLNRTIIHEFKINTQKIEKDLDMIIKRISYDK